MRVYSETIFSYIEKCEKMLKDILRNETDFSVRRKRFEYKGFLYPIDVIVFEGQNLGQFDPAHYQIGINRDLVYKDKDSVVKNILRHELAHYIAFIFYGADIAPHGNEFKHVCSLFNWPSEISRASMNLETANEVEGDIASEKILNKVKNLLKLAESDNPHEAELATIKANKLLLKHNLEYSNIERDETYYVQKVLTQKRKDARLGAIYEILQHFMVRPILSYGKQEVSIEVTGTKTNLELAQYVSTFLDRELDKLWSEHKKQHKLKGLKAKNSFYYGLAKGYSEKMNTVNKSFSGEESKALMVISKNLDLQVQKIYNRLSSSTSSSQRDAASFNLGKKAGKSLNINQSIKSKAKTFLLE